MLISNIPAVLQLCFRSGETLMINGEHGIGKSDIIENFARDNDMVNETLFLSTQEIGDLVGNPVTVERHGDLIHTWTKPIWLKRLDEAVMPNEMMFDDLEFLDEGFKEFVQIKLKEKYGETNS
jgi:MoxR-like ATPase